MVRLSHRTVGVLAGVSLPSYSRYVRCTLLENAMSVWELAAALVPTMLILVAGITLIEHLRVKGEGDRYRHREYRADEDPSHGNGSRGNGRSGNGRAKQPGRK